ncbi:MAG: aspartate carbamoyltransferase regulatory subunit [Candidatus Thermoplasmatota archaeon]|jgi:aspartate carbamoyltransferase regulatory subunit|nr:aspartate carbamoyltransferase regulatory subunit [Candidatus Thermoplasmatota archaeon]MCL5680450.1 aspartate carbamoyltransferase regulatory subunit [Candidatus Thermoplasmatota archaeon]
MSEEQTLKIEKIQKGTVIDHIPVGRALQVLKILNIYSDIGLTVSIAIHVKSKKLGLKDVIKIEERILDSSELNKIALVAEGATISIVDNFEVIKKFSVKAPEVVIGILRCSNPRCITNTGENVKSSFIITSKDPIILKCHYCEREMETDEIIENIV